MRGNRWPIMDSVLKLLGIKEETLIEHVDIVLIPDRAGPFEIGMLNGQVFRLDKWPVMVIDTFALGITVRYMPFWKWLSYDNIKNNQKGHC